MLFDPELRTLKEVAAHLPFNLDDVAEAGYAFTRWRTERRDADREIVELWTYCYVRRYFLQKFMRRTDHPLADFDVLVEAAFTIAHEAAPSIENPERYAHWVSVICRNKYISYVLGPPSPLPLHEEADAFMEAEPPAPAPADTAAVRSALDAAVLRLPHFLQDVARLRFLEKHSYEEITLITGQNMSVIRSYVSKAIARFRKDAVLRRAVEKATDKVFSY